MMISTKNPYTSPQLSLHRCLYYNVVIPYITVHRNHVDILIVKINQSDVNALLTILQWLSLLPLFLHSHNPKVFPKMVHNF